MLRAFKELLGKIPRKPQGSRNVNIRSDELVIMSASRLQQAKIIEERQERNRKIIKLIVVCAICANLGVSISILAVVNQTRIDANSKPLMRHAYHFWNITETVTNKPLLITSIPIDKKTTITNMVMFTYNRREHVDGSVAEFDAWITLDKDPNGYDFGINLRAYTDVTEALYGIWTGSLTLPNATGYVVSFWGMNNDNLQQSLNISISVWYETSWQE